jgi:hypothetical protein
MHANAQLKENVVELVPDGERSLAHLSDSELLMATRRLVGTSNRLFAALLLHLAEVEIRGIHRQRARSTSIHIASMSCDCPKTPLRAALAQRAG